MSWLQISGAVALTTAAVTGINANNLTGESPIPEIASDMLAYEAVDLIDLQPQADNRFTVPVTIMGEGPYNFMIDTGSQATVVSRDLADQLELFDRNTATLVAMNSQRQVETAFIPDVTLGSRTFPIRTAPLLEALNLSGVDGILGVDSLQNQRVLLDFENNTITVADAADLGGNRGFDILVRARQKLGQLIITSASLDGVRTAVVIDTGAQGSIGNAALLQRLRNRSRDLGDRLLTDVHGVSSPGQLRIARTLTLERMEISNIPITFSESPVFKQLNLQEEPALILGMSELRLFKRVAIDFAQRKVLFSMNRSGPSVVSGSSMLGF